MEEKKRTLLEKKALDILIDIDEFRKLVELYNPSGNPLRPLLDILERWYTDGNIVFSNIKERMQECSVPVPKNGKKTLEKLREEINKKVKDRN